MATPPTGNQRDNRVLSDEQLRVIRDCRCVCFDVDSTVLTYEGIDVLAEYHGCGAAVQAYTAQAMNGQCTFQSALEARLQIIQPQYTVLQHCIETHPCTLTPGMDTLVQRLQSLGKEVYLISGGFRQMIEPAARKLNIPLSNIYANVLQFDSEPPHQFIDFDGTQPTAQSGGKAVALQQIKARHHWSNNDVIMIGDGVTDLEARTECAMFIGYGGVARRDAVVAGADWFITNWSQLIEHL